MHLNVPLSILPLAIIAACLAAPISGQAQSWKHPPAVDYDHAQEQYSRLWEDMIATDDHGYVARVRHAVQRWDNGEQDQHKLVLMELAAAAKSQPNAPSAYFWSGMLSAKSQQWDTCATDLERAIAIDPDFRPTKITDHKLEDPRFVLAYCHLYAGRYESAIASIRRLLSDSNSSPQTNLLLGESLMALGQLNQAVEFLHRAWKPGIRNKASYALAVALDRREHISDSRKLLNNLVARDFELRVLLNPKQQFAPQEDKHYYLGLAYAAQKKSNLARYHFRVFLRLAPTSLWKKRTEAHLRILGPSVVGDNVSLKHIANRQKSSVVNAIRAHHSALSACVAQPDPALVLARVDLAVAPKGTQSRFKATATLELHIGVGTTQKNNILECLKSVAATIKIPTVTARTNANSGAKSAPSVVFTVLTPQSSSEL